MYGIDGQLGGRYLDATRSVLRRIATVSEQVNKSFDIQVNEAAAPRLSRMAAYLHLRYHQVRFRYAQNKGRGSTSANAESCISSALS